MVQPLALSYNNLLFALQSPNDPTVLSTNIHTVQNNVALQRKALEDAENEMKFLSLSKKQWSWIATVTPVLAVITPYADKIYELINLNTSDSDCENSTATKVSGSLAVVLALGFITAKAITKYLSKKRKKIVSPFEEQLEQLRFFELHLKTIRMLFDANNPPQEKEEIFVKFAHEMKNLNKNQQINQYQQQCFFLASQSLPDNCEIKQMMREADQIAEEIAEEEQNSSSSYPNQTENEDLEMGLSTSSSSDSPAPRNIKMAPLYDSIETKRKQLRKLTKKLKTKLGLDEFYTGKLYYDSSGKIITIE